MNVRRPLQIFAFLIASLLGSSALAQSAHLEISKTSNNITSLRIHVDGLEARNGYGKRYDQGLCDSSSFGLDIIDTKNLTKKAYVSGAKNDAWKVNSNKCNINMQLRNELLQPGMVLKLETRDDYGYATHQFYVRIPCSTSIEALSVQTIDFTITEIKEVTMCGGIEQKNKDDNSVIIVQPNPKQEPLPEANCSATLSKEDNGNTIALSMYCGRTVNASVIVESEDGLDTFCRKGDLNFSYATVCRFENPSPRRTQSYSVRLKDLDTGSTQRFEETVTKVATYNYAPTVRLTSSSNLVIQKYKPFLSWTRWESTVTAIVNDRDLDNSSAEIKVQLVLVSEFGEQILDEKLVSNGSEVNLLIFQYATATSPIKVGQENVVKVRVFDAYKGSEIIETAPIRVYLNP